MTQKEICSGPFSSSASLADAKSRLLVSFAVPLLLAATCLAQGTPANDAPADATLTVPVGTKIPLALTNLISTRTVHRGDEIRAQITFPVAEGDQILIPAGTYVRGKVDKLVRRGSRGELQLESTSLFFSNGYVAVMDGPATMVSDEGTARRDPGAGAMTGVLAAMALPTAGALAGGASNGARGAGIGAGVGLGAGAVTAIMLLSHSRNFTVEAGATLDMVLQEPLVLRKDRVADAITRAKSQPVALIQQPGGRTVQPFSTFPGMCYTPGTPATPSTYVPGTPPMGGSPGTPGTYLAGTPAGPPIPHPCP